MSKPTYLGKLLESFAAVSTKIKDNKIIALNELNKRLIANTNYRTLQLWTLQDLERIIGKMMAEYDITRLQASEKLKEVVRKDTEIWRLKNDEQFFKKIDK